MLINSANLRTLYVGFSTAFQNGMAIAAPKWNTVAMEVPSNTAKEEYGWLGAMPSLREWIGDRVIHNLSLHDYAIINRKFESTVSVPRPQVEDDTFGVLRPAFEMMGRDAATHPDKLVFGLLKAGFTTPCYDGQYFFDGDHPVGGAGDEPVSSASNTGGGSGTAWYLLDCSKPVKPLIFQKRLPYEMQQITSSDDERVFLQDEYLYGVRARANAGFGLWQLAYGSKQTLDPTNYAAARAAMMSLKGDNGTPLDVTPTHLVVPPILEGAARAVLNADRNANGAANIWAGSAELIVTSYVL